MPTMYSLSPDGKLVAAGDDLNAFDDSVVWIDAISPSDAELAKLDAIMGIEVPNRHDITEIELSNRLYREDGALVMIANLLPKNEQAPTPPRPAAFILKNNLLITIRYSAFYSFERVAARISSDEARTAVAVFCQLIEEAVSDRADNLEYSMRLMEVLTSQLFRAPSAPGDAPKENPELDHALRQIGAMGESVANIRESITSLQRVVNYAGVYIPHDWLGDQRVVLDSLKSDLTALSDEAAFFMNKLNFNLDATLGMINIEESKIIRFLSVVMLLLSPPTLIAGIYGMNFEIMPELRWPGGYAFAIVLMVGTAIASLVYLKRKHWL